MMGILENDQIDTLFIHKSVSKSLKSSDFRFGGKFYPAGFVSCWKNLQISPTGHFPPHFLSFPQKGTLLQQ